MLFFNINMNSFHQDLCSFGYNLKIVPQLSVAILDFYAFINNNILI